MNGNPMKWWPLVMTAAAVVASFSASQVQIAANEKAITKLQQREESQIRTEEQVKQLKRDLEEVKEAVDKNSRKLDRILYEMRRQAR